MIAACFMLSALMGLVWNIFSLLLVEIQDHRGWSVSNLSLAFSIFVLSYTIATPVVAEMIARLGSRPAATVLLVLLCAGLGGSTQTTSVWAFYLCYGVMAGIGSHSLGSLLIFTVLLQRFRKKGTTAVAIADSGTGFGIVAGFPAMHALFAFAGWQNALLWLAGATLVVGLCLHGLVPASKREVHGKRQKSTSESVRSWPFVVLIGAVFAGAMVLQGYQSHQIALLEELGSDRAGAVYVMSLLAGVMTIARALSGAVVDQFGTRITMAGCLTATLLSTICLIAFMTTQSMAWLIAATIFFAVGLGSQGIIVTGFTRTITTGATFIRAYGVVRLSTGLGLMAGPALTAIAYDRTGNYHAALALFGIAATLHFSLFFLAGSVHRRKREPVCPKAP